MLLTFFFLSGAIDWNSVDLILELSGFDSVMLRHVLRCPKFLRIFITGGRGKFNEKVGKALERFSPATVSCISDKYLEKMERLKQTYISSRILFCYFRLQEMSYLLNR